MTDLQGAHVLVTRPAHQADNLCRLLAGRGAVPVRLPTLAIQALPTNPNTQETLANLGKYQWLIFISANAVNFALNANGGKILQFAPARLAAIGKATAQALVERGLVADCIPSQSADTAALLAEPAFAAPQGQPILIVRGTGGREELAEALRERGALVSYLEVYRRVMPELDTQEVVALLATDRLQAVTVTSGEALANLFVLLPQEAHALLTKLPVVVISARLAELADRLGFKQIAVAAQPADTAILEAVSKCLTGN